MSTMALSVVSGLVIVLFHTSFVDSTLRLANSFSNHMVLQQAPESAILWGYADKVGETVSIVKNGVRVASTTTFQNSNIGSSVAKWKVKIPPESQHGPFSITAESPEGNVTLHDVMFGDVWICSGQSNMQFSMLEVYNHTAEIDDSLNYSDIRMLFSQVKLADTPQDDVVLQHSWIKPIKGFIEQFSAVCFMFGRELQKTLNYPIGLIETNLGGTRIEAWSSPDALAKCRNVTKRADPNAESVLWNTMVHPYLATTIKGAIWYQGESNIWNPAKYTCSFPAMISDWRKKFHVVSMQETSENFPFGFVQLAPQDPDSSLMQLFPLLRWSQTVDHGFVPNPDLPHTFMAVTIDLPDSNSTLGSIHPRYKQDVASRLALGALAVAYGDSSVVFQGPYPSSYLQKLSNNRLQITFDGGQSTLVLNNKDGFEVCCSPSVCQDDWKKTSIVRHLKSMVEIDTSVCPTGGHASAVRYLWKDSPCALKQCALYGQTNYLPVPPFTQNGPFNTTNAPSLSFANSFGDHMVLQQAPESAILWGYADVVGDTITILKNGVHVASTTTYKNSYKGSSVAKWKVKIPPESQHGPFNITAESSEGNVTLHDVMFGDVWICSGQSNMQFSMIQVMNYTAEIDDSLNYPNIRMLFSKLVTADTLKEDVVIQRSWRKPTKGSIEYFSAVCFMFGRELQKTRNYPIGLIESNWGGTRIEAWSSPDALARCNTVGKSTKHFDGVLPKCRNCSFHKLQLRHFGMASSIHFRANQNAESVLWNAMIHPYLATTIKGAIWYQGEANAGNPSKYACSFPAMISDWRKKFHAESMQETSENFPFGFVQLAPSIPDTNVVGGFPALRWSQTVDHGFVPNPNMPYTFMAVAIDLPDFKSPSGYIHPRYKQDIASRLALGALSVAYGDKSVVFQGPYPSGYLQKLSNKRLQITFDSGHAALIVNNNDGFEVCCSATTCQRNWVKSSIVGHAMSMVEIDTSVCPSGQHVAGVRYLWRESPCALRQCALYGQTNNLPVPPFTQNGPFNGTTGAAAVGR